MYLDLKIQEEIFGRVIGRYHVDSGTKHGKSQIKI